MDRAQIPPVHILGLLVGALWPPIPMTLTNGALLLRELCQDGISALRYALRHGHASRIWRDNAFVVDTLRVALHDPDRCQPHRKDSDLWTALLALARSVPPDLVTVHKIASHQNKLGADFVECCAYTGNDNADHCAQCVSAVAQSRYCH